MIQGKLHLLYLLVSHGQLKQIEFERVKTDELN